MTTTNNYLRTSLILNDVNEVNGEYKPKEMLVDYNDGFNIYFIDEEGNKYSPTLYNKNFAMKLIKSHMISNNQHTVADEINSGFMSSDDRRMLIKLEELYDYIIENPFKEIEGNIDGYVINKEDCIYKIEGNSIVFNRLSFKYNNYPFTIEDVTIDVGERTEERAISYIYLDNNINVKNIGKLKFDIQIKITTDEEIIKDKKVIMVIDRFNNKPFTTMNPYGYIGEANELNNVEIISMIDKSSNRETHNLHFGINRYPITENTLVMIDVVDYELKDIITNTNLDKNSTFKLAPVGLIQATSETKGINIPISFDSETFTLEFMLFDDKNPNIVNEPIISIKDKEYNTLFDIKSISKSTDEPESKSIHIQYNEDLKLTDIISGFNLYKIVYNEGNISVYINDNLVLEGVFRLPVNNANFLELSAQNTPIGDLRLSKINLEENLTPLDIVNNKGSLHPLLTRGYRKISNESSHIFNSIKVNYQDLGLIKSPDTNNAWHVKDSILLYKNEDEIITGIYNSKDRQATVTGIKSKNSLYLDNIDNIRLYDSIRIIKFNKNLSKIFKIVNIDESDKSIQVVETIDNDIKYVNIDGSYIYANIFNSDVIPSIEVKDESGKVLDIAHYPDEEGNVKIELLENSQSDNLYISYLIITDYKNILPKFDTIEKAFMDDVECIEMTNKDTIKVPVNNYTLYKHNGVTYKPVEENTNNIEEYFESDDNTTVKYKVEIDTFSELSRIRIMEETIIANMIDNLEINANIANTLPLTIKSDEETLELVNSNIIREVKAKFICTDISLINGVYTLYIEFNGSKEERAFLMNDIRFFINLRSIKKNERIFVKKNSMALEDMFVISNVEGNRYIKTLINTDGDTTFMLSTTRVKEETNYDNHI